MLMSTKLTTPISDAKRALHNIGRIVATAAKDKPARICALRQAAMSLRPHVRQGWINPAEATDQIYELAVSHDLVDEPEINEILQLVTHPLGQKAEEPPPHDIISDSADGHEIVIVPPPPSLDVWDAGDDVELPPPRQWLLGNQFCCEFLSGLIAPAGRASQRFDCSSISPLRRESVFPANTCSSVAAC
jgi:hypothetical protein